jgi:hypothetical protein
VFGRSILLFDLRSDLKPEPGSDRVDRQQLAALGDVRTPSIADLFVAMLGSKPADKPGNQVGKALGNYEGAAI